MGNKARRAIRPTRKPSCLIFLLLRNYGLRRMGPVNGRYCSLGLITHSQFQRRLVHGLDVSEYERNEGHSRSLVIGVCVCVCVCDSASVRESNWRQDWLVQGALIIVTLSSDMSPLNVSSTSAVAASIPTSTTDNAQHATSQIQPQTAFKPWLQLNNKNFAIANISRVSCAHNTSRASIGLITHDVEIYVKGHSKSLETEPLDRPYATI